MIKSEKQIHTNVTLEKVLRSPNIYSDFENEAKDFVRSEIIKMPEDPSETPCKLNFEDACIKIRESVKQRSFAYETLGSKKLELFTDEQLLALSYHALESLKEYSYEMMKAVKPHNIVKMKSVLLEEVRVCLGIDEINIIGPDNLPKIKGCPISIGGSQLDHIKDYIKKRDPNIIGPDNLVRINHTLLINIIYGISDDKIKIIGGEKLVEMTRNELDKVENLSVEQVRKLWP